MKHIDDCIKQVSEYVSKSSKNGQMDVSQLLEPEYRFLEKLVTVYGVEYIQEAIEYIAITKSERNDRNGIRDSGSGR